MAKRSRSRGKQPVEVSIAHDAMRRLHRRMAQLLAGLNISYQPWTHWDLAHSDTSPGHLDFGHWDSSHGDRVHLDDGGGFSDGGFSDEGFSDDAFIERAHDDHDDAPHRDHVDDGGEGSSGGGEVFPSGVWTAALAAFIQEMEKVIGIVEAGITQTVRHNQARAFAHTSAAIDSLSRRIAAIETRLASGGRTAGRGTAARKTGK